jgi:eukaryotic-like serine/threonine-protein kinase
MRRSMVSGPDGALRDRLLRSGVCSERDLGRARRRIQRLGDDLPMFDSVWLDTLAQMGRLTPFQVEQLEAGGDLLFPAIAGEPGLIVETLDRQGSGATLLVRDAGRRMWTARHVTLAGDELASRLSTLRDVLARYAHSAPAVAPSPVVTGPAQLVDFRGAAWLVEPHVAGPSTLDLLIRRGRFPAAVVRELARQLVFGLADLERAGFVHGDLSPGHLVLARDGHVVATRAVVRPILDPEIALGAVRPAEEFDGLAPELIGTGNPATSRSDLYALGCTLYHLLAGRPPFPGGDPLGKLFAHQTRAVPDPRELAPATDDFLAAEILHWTAHQPTERPTGWRQVADRWRLEVSPRPAVLRDFLARCEAPAPRLAGERRGGGLLGSTLSRAVVGLLIVAGIGIYVREGAARSDLLAIGWNWAARFSQREPVAVSSDSSPAVVKSGPVAAGAGSATGQDTAGRFALPGLNAQGVLELESGRVYRAGRVVSPGVVTVRSSGAANSVLEIDDVPLVIECAQLRIEGLSFRQSGAPSPGTGVGALLQVAANRLELERCRFDMVASEAAEAADKSPRSQRAIASVTAAGRPAIVWHVGNRTDARSGMATLTNVVWFGHAAGLTATSAARVIELTNCLKVGQGPIVSYLANPMPAGTRVVLRHVTCRQSGAVLRWRPAAAGAGPESLVVEALECLFDPHPSMGLLELFHDEGSVDLLMAMRVQGEGSIVRPETRLATWTNSQTRRSEPVDEHYLTVEGLTAETPRFIGPATNHPADSALHEAQAPRRGDQLQGIAPEGLPLAPHAQTPPLDRR